MNLFNGKKKEGSNDHGSTTEYDKLINNVSSIVSESHNYRKSNMVNSNSFNNELTSSNFNESSESSGRVWSKEKINMKATIGNLMDNLSDSVKTREVISQIKMLDTKHKTKGEMTEFLPPNKLYKLERKTQYDLTQKEMKHWGATIDRINRQEIISYGEPEKMDIVSIGQLATNYQPLDEFEQEFDNVLKEMNRDDSKNAEILGQCDISPCNKIKDQSEKSFMKKLKFILFQQQKENKRLKKIKSKTWRKNRRKQMQIEEEKLLSLGEVEYPELVKKIRERYEEKRAKIRLMRRQTARQKWAKMALRFGGNELQKNISDQAQKQHEEKKRIEQIIQNVSKNLDEGSELSDSDNETESNLDLIEKARKNINELKNSSNSLFDLKFIQRGIEYNNNLLDLELNQLDQESFQDKILINEPNEHLSNNISDEIIKLSRPSVNEIMETKNKIQGVLNYNQDIIGVNFSDNNLNNQLTSNINDSNCLKFKINENNLDLMTENVEKKSKIYLNVEDELERMASIDIVENQEFAQANSELLKHIFIEGNPDHIPKDVDVDNSSESRSNIRSSNNKSVPGWGNWCSSLSKIMDLNIRGKKDSSGKAKKLINSNRSIDKKVTKYCVNQVPHPYTSSDLYESTFRHPIGPEWNTTAIHNKLIQPKIQTRIGAVIKPLVYSKHLRNIQISDSFLEKWNLTKKCNRTKARF
ncbi:Utp14 protein family protein [Cryptosporidium meleagridis]|uniref:Utp14 protein family protein n=1 Tax=Cryptosporidium meleagridis TaxID=93969 RepID=A0A2P4YWA9_9CRYT|nr:Utp14 protein family protein [Cryptosporidium meleagridis]